MDIICFDVRVHGFLVQLQGCCLLRELGNIWSFPDFFCVVMFIFRTLQMDESDVEIMNGSIGMLVYYTMLDFFSFKDHKFERSIPYGVCQTSIIVLVLFLSD